MNLVEFLKTYTKINNDFIDDFFGLYNVSDKYNFCIDIEKIALWFDTRKSDLKSTLKNSYNINVDYIIKKYKNDGRIGKMKEIILLTPKCFKLMAMQSKTKKSIQVREYYYELEQVVDQYKEYIIQGLKSKIKKLENNQKPKINPKKGVIYILETNEIGHYKLGKTSNLKQRLRSYNGDKNDDIIPIYIYETDDIDIVEKCVKTYAKKYQYRKYKEIYKTDLNMLKELINDCSDFNNKTNLKIKYNKKKTTETNHYIYIDKLID